MRATVMYGAGDVRVEDVADARLIDPADALVRVTCVFDRTGSIEDVPDGYRAMNDREVLKFQIKP